MPILIERLDQPFLNYLIFVGRVSRGEALAFPARISPDRPEFGSRWLTIFSAAADLSELDADCLLALKERLRPVVAQAQTKGPFRMILVSNSKFNDLFMACWRAMTATDPSYPSNPETATSVSEACARHGFSPSEVATAAAWIEMRLEQAS